MFANHWKLYSRFRKLSGQRTRIIHFHGMRDELRHWDKADIVAGSIGRLGQRTAREERNGWIQFMKAIFSLPRITSKPTRTSTSSLERLPTDSIFRITEFLGLWIPSWLLWLVSWFKTYRLKQHGIWEEPERLGWVWRMWSWCSNA